jgi:hypothetical protein
MMKIDLSKYRESQHPALDPTTPWFEFLSYCECCTSLNAPNQPSIGRFMRYRNYLKEIGVL